MNEMITFVTKYSTTRNAEKGLYCV